MKTLTMRLPYRQWSRAVDAGKLPEIRGTLHAIERLMSGKQGRAIDRTRLAAEAQHLTRFLLGNDQA